MSKTAGCVFALGVCMVLAAACGDDDGGPAAGGNGGAAGLGGGAGSGDSGAPLGGSAGTPSGGASGAPAGAAGESGNGGSAGGGAEPDGGTGDGGGVVVVGDCPAFATAALEIGPQDGQQLAIARVLFNSNGTADVVVRNPLAAGGDAIGISTLTQVCSGEGDNDCVALSDFEGGEDFVPGQERTVTVDAVPAAGEIAILNDVPSEISFAHAYIAWGATFVSVAPTGTPPDGGVLLSLEERAFEAQVWLDDPQQRIVLAAGQNTIVADGDTALDAGFATCTR